MTKTYKKTPLLSVIIPVYNDEPYLPRCLDSIVSQTYVNLEAILIDDGSNDNCGLICDEYAEKYSCITVVHKENGGVASARNLGLDMARGDIIGFVDADDWIEPNMYELMIENMMATGSDIVQCGSIEVVDDGIEKARKSQAHEVFDNREALRRSFQEIGNNGVVWNKIYRRELIENLRFPLGVTREDSCFASRAFGDAKLISWVEECAYYYRVDSVISIMRSPNTYFRIKSYLELYRDQQQFISSRFPELQPYVDFHVCANLPARIIEQLMNNYKKDYPELYAESLEILATHRKRIKLSNNPLSKRENRRLWFVTYMRVLIRPLLKIKLLFLSFKK